MAVQDDVKDPGDHSGRCESRRGEVMRTFVMLILIGVLGMPLVHALVTSSLVAQTSTQYGAWTHDVSQDDFSGETIETASVSGERLMLLVSCYKGKDYFMSIHFLGSAIFRDGSVALRWDEGLVEHYTFQDNNEHLSAATLLQPYNHHANVDDHYQAQGAFRITGEGGEAIPTRPLRTGSR